jgi:hypothetical protein
MRSVNIKRTLLILFATAVVTVMLISVGLATLASERADVKLPPNSSFVAICPLHCKWWADACGDVRLGQLDRG